MSNQKLSLYAALKAAGIPLDSHESDLYVRVTPASCAILQDAVLRGAFTGNPNMFRDHLGQLWYELPFAYDPFWEAHARTPHVTGGVVLLVAALALGLSSCGDKSNPLQPAVSCALPGFGITTLPPCSPATVAAEQAAQQAQQQTVQQLKAQP